MPSSKRILTVAAAALGATAAASALLHRMHAQEVRSRTQRVLQRSAPAVAADLDARLAGLPAPVQRYLRLALASATAIPAAVEMEQSGRLRTAPDAARWLDFTARHTVSPRGCAFLWNARVRLGPLLHLRVVDALQDGRGAGQVLLQSLLRVAEDGGTEEMHAGALHRFLAEAVWYPWALLPSEQLKWEPVDARTARATLTCHGTSVSLEFRFAASGVVAGIYSEGRWGSFDGGYQRLPWEGRFSDHVREQGVLMPRQGEVGWHRDGALQLVWQGTLQSWRPRSAP